MNKIDQKIFTSFDHFFDMLQRWKVANNVIVFTNGCFDILHRGHADYLEKSAMLGNKLVVGLNTDASVRLLKGENRPVNAENDRAFLLASLLVVDAVILFDEETPYELIRKLGPDILVKGNDYAIEEIAGFDLVLARGGRVETVELTPGFSSSQLITKIKKTY